MNGFQPTSSAEKKENVVIFDAAVLHYGAANTTDTEVVKLEFNLYDRDFTERPEDFKKVEDAFVYDIGGALFQLDDLLKP